MKKILEVIVCWIQKREAIALKRIQIIKHAWENH